MRSKVGYGYTPPKPCFTDRNGHNSIDDFPLVPESPSYVHVHATVPDHSAIRSGSPSRVNVENRRAQFPDSATQQPAPPQANPPQTRPDIAIVARETCIPLNPPDADETAADESAAAAEADSLLALLRAAEEPVEPARPERPRPPAKKRRRKSRPRKSQSLAPQPSSLTPRDHHERQCSICNHPERDAIEEEFLHWYAPSLTANHFNVGWRALYRHAHATGLYAARERNLRSALGHIVEQACHITPTVDGVLRAIRAYSCLNRDGQWTEPPAHVVVSSGNPTRIAVPNEHREPRGGTIPTGTLTLELPASSASHPELPDNENK